MALPSGGDAGHDARYAHSQADSPVEPLPGRRPCRGAQCLRQTAAIFALRIWSAVLTSSSVTGHLFDGT